MRKTILLISLLLFSTLFTACASFHDTYKPLYQVKPQTESLRGN